VEACKAGISYKLIATKLELKIKVIQIDIDKAPYIIINVYISLSEQLTVDYLQEIERLISLSQRYLIVGDFNAHNPIWGSDRVNLRGKLIEDFTVKHSACILNDGRGTYVDAPNKLLCLDKSLVSSTIGLSSTWSRHPSTMGNDPYKHKTQLPFINTGTAT